MEESRELLKLFENKDCDYNKCRNLIKEIGGCTQIVEDNFGLKTTPLHEAIACGHYDFALELIGEPGADLDVDPGGLGTVIWELQYYNAETKEEQAVETENKLKLLRALIQAGANPNPRDADDGEKMLDWLRYKINEGEGDYRLWQMKQIMEAYAYGETARFLRNLREQSVGCIMLLDDGYWLIDDDLCDCDQAVFIFENGERMALASYQVGEDEWDFYAVPIQEDVVLDPTMYHTIVADNHDSIKFLSWYTDPDIPTSHWLDLSLDDAILRIYAEGSGMMVGTVCHDFMDYEQTKRKNLFLDNEKNERSVNYVLIQ